MRQMLEFGLRSWLQILIVAAITALTVVVAPPSAGMAQLPGLPSLNASSSLPPGVQRVGNLEVTSITLDGKKPVQHCLSCGV